MMIKQNIFKTYPLELSRFKRNVWEGSGYMCFAIIDDKESVKKRTLEYAKRIFRQTKAMFIVMWDFCLDLESLWCRENFQSVNLIKERDDLLVYEITAENEIEFFLDIWGEMDSMDFIFPKEREVFVGAMESREFSSFNRFRKCFLKRVFQSVAIIGDSGDGEESQFVIENIFVKENFDFYV